MKFVDTGEQEVGVCIIVPSAGGLARYTMFELSIEALVAPVGSGLARCEGITGFAYGINEVVGRIIAPYYWLLDDDHEFDADVLLRLIKHRVPVVSALTVTKQPPFKPVIFKGQEPSKCEKHGYAKCEMCQHKEGIEHIWYDWDDLSGRYGIMPVFAGPKPGMLIARQVFDAMPKPWFEVGQYESDKLGEDLWFCEKLRKAGIPMYVDLDAVTGHIAPCAIRPVRKKDGSFTVKLHWGNNMSLVLGSPK